MANPAYIALVYFLVSVPSLLQDYHAKDNNMDKTLSSLKPSYILNRTEVFDFVIIGGGTAGAVIANRLSKIRGFSVLVLERGGTPTPLSAMPYLWLYLARTDWPGSVERYPTVPQPNYQLATNGIATLLGGQVLGGTSTLNQLVYTRGNPAIYDEWAQITGDDEWSYEKVLPFFKKSEDYHGTFPLDERYHSTGGEWYVETANLVHPSAQIFMNAVREKNISIHDMNAHQSLGFQPIDFNSKRGKRWGTYEAFLEPIIGRSNLNIYRYATATKIHLDNSNKAHGVTYTRHGQTRFVRARKEIIVSAGIFESPKLLMLSGIGPAQDLEAVGVKPIIDLPVGQNLQDHISTTVQVVFNQSGIAFVPERDYSEQTKIEYATTGYGPLHNIFATLGYMSTSLNPKPNIPDIQFFVSHQSDPIANTNISETIRPDSNFISVYLVTPTPGSGFVKLRSANPTDKLVIDPKYGANPVDLQRMAEGIKFIADIYENSNTYSTIGAKLNDAGFPAKCKALPFRSEEYWKCILEIIGIGGYHFTGTCSMNSVVDSKLRVLGTEGLRVADTSIMPTLPNGNTAAPAVMVGEKAADFILRQWNKSSLTSLFYRP